MPRTALVAGASGLIGGFLLERLLADPRWERVIAVGRRALPREHSKLVQRTVDLGRLTADLAGVSADDVFCCLGTTIAKAGSQEAFRRVDLDAVVDLGGWAAAAGAQQFLVVSSMGADPRSRVFYSRIKGAMEQAVASLAIPSVSIVRPALLLGSRQESRLGERLFAALLRPVAPLLAGPLADLRPIEADTVAAALVELARREQPGVARYSSSRLRELGKSPS
jgi:uncharacterized protein YbjT (DUF2867 family)